MRIDRRSFLAGLVLSPFGTKLRLPEISRAAERYIPLPPLNKWDEMVSATLANRAANIAADVTENNALRNLLEERNAPLSIDMSNPGLGKFRLK